MPYYFSPFRKTYAEDMKKRSPNYCPFCDPEVVKKESIKNAQGKIIENEHYRWMISWYPRSEGHTLIVPKQHLLPPGADESPEEIVAKNKLILFASDVLRKMYAGSGIEIYMHYGALSKATVPHLHTHVMPAQSDDPLRGFQKWGYFNNGEDGGDERTQKAVMFPIKIKLAREDLLEALKQVLGNESLEK